jgi:hypothetical protein
MIHFVKANRAAFDGVPTALISVSMTERGVEDPALPSEVRAKAAENVKRVVDNFCRQTGLHPARVWPVAGALMYSEYGTLTRLVMRMIAKQEHADTDTSRDYEYTDWQALDRFVESFAEEVDRPVPIRTTADARQQPPAAPERLGHAVHVHGSEAGALAGEIVGGLVGSAAGPAGLVAGMVLGAAAGALAGQTIDKDAARTSRHDKELDDAIGVTQGDLGRPRQAGVKPS